MSTALKRLEWVFTFLGFLARHWNTIVSLAGGFLAAWTANAANAFNEYAPFSWIASGIMGFVLISVGLQGLAQARLLSQHFRIRRFSTEVDAVNPLESTFQKRRINVTQIQPPVGNEVRGRTFVECDIVGPANILVFNCSFQGSQGSAIDAVLWSTGNRPTNCTVFVDCTFTNCRFFLLTFLVPTSGFEDFSKHGFRGLNWLSMLPQPQTKLSDVLASTES